MIKRKPAWQVRILHQVHQIELKMPRHIIETTRGIYIVISVQIFREYDDKTQYFNPLLHKSSVVRFAD